MDNVINLFGAAVLAGTPLLLGTLGNILTSKAGNLNLGVEGMMFMGAASGLAGAYYYEQWALGALGASSGAVAALMALIFSFLAGALGALIYAFLTITLRANQNVTGLTLAIFGAGFGNFFGEFMGIRAGGYVAVSNTVKAAFGGVKIPILSDIPYVGRILFQYNWVVYLAVAIALLMAFFLGRTRTGLHLRAVGENPATADAVGIRVSLYKYVATVVGGGICGVGGMYMVMVTCSGVWVHNCVNGYGWLAVALVIFAAWSPMQALLAALIFGGLSIMRMYVPLGIPMQLYDMLPYIATVAVLVLTSVHQSRERSQPAGCGINYFREER
ncbi:MAG: ABC transporter permease [Oscillospiraceae bacterium]|jgi:simple sugar transport system permease protein|nr:ABC transporter permease [Oscillospiraceae bacterium]